MPGASATTEAVVCKVDREEWDQQELNRQTAREIPPLYVLRGDLVNSNDLSNLDLE